MEKRDKIVNWEEITERKSPKSKKIFVCFLVTLNEQTLSTEVMIFFLLYEAKSNDFSLK